MIRMLAMGRCVCGLEVVGIACYSFPGVLWTGNACVGDSYWDSREMENARSVMGKAEPNKQTNKQNVNGKPAGLFLPEGPAPFARTPLLSKRP